jgi:hypothetical protein
MFNYRHQYDSNQTGYNPTHAPTRISLTPSGS